MVGQYQNHVSNITNGQIYIYIYIYAYVMMGRITGFHDCLVKLVLLWASYWFTWRKTTYPFFGVVDYQAGVRASGK